MINIIVPGEPVGKGRPRFGRGRAYTPEKTANAEAVVRECARAVYPEKKHLISGPVCLTVMFFMTIPKSWSKKKQHQAAIGEVRPTSTPDLDNLLKLVGDALNGVVYLDDKQIIEVKGEKFYSFEPGTDITVHTL